MCSGGKLFLLHVTWGAVQMVSSSCRVAVVKSLLVRGLNSDDLVRAMHLFVSGVINVVAHQIDPELHYLTSAQQPRRPQLWNGAWCLSGTMRGRGMARSK